MIKKYFFKQNKADFEMMSYKNFRMIVQMPRLRESNFDFKTSLEIKTSVEDLLAYAATESFVKLAQVIFNSSTMQPINNFQVL